MDNFVYINSDRETIDYIFYDTHTDIYRLYFSLPEYVLDQEMEFHDDELTDLKVTIPKSRSRDLLDFIRHYLLDSDDENKPSRLVEFSLESKGKLVAPFDKYYHPLLKNAISYYIEDNKIIVELEIPEDELNRIDNIIRC